MASPPESRQPRRHNIRGEDGKFTPPESPHHKVVQSSYARTQLSQTRAFTPDQDAAITAAEGSSR
jgi:hypothetical protein